MTPAKAGWFQQRRASVPPHDCATFMNGPGPVITPVASTPDRATVAGRSALRALWLGRVTHDDAMAVQAAVHADRVAGRVADTLLILEHESVYTAGRATDPAHYLVPPAELEAAGHAVRAVSRGGELTWHGPGQITCYPIVDLRERGRDIHRYLRELERALIAVAAGFGIEAFTIPGRTGCWCADGKIGSIGIRVERWVSLHGTAFNIAPDLDRFAAIVPCGLEDAATTSVARVTGTSPSTERAARVHAEAFATALDSRLSDDSELPRER